MQRRVVITGLGVYSALGTNCADFWDSILAGKCGIEPISLGEQELPKLTFSNGAQVRGYEPADHFSKRELDLMDRFSQFTTLTAREAVANAKLEWTDELRENTAIVTGTALAAQAMQDEAYYNTHVLKKKRVHPLTIPRCMANAAASHLSMEFGIQGPTLALGTACSSANHSIGTAFQMVRAGIADAALAGGAECPFTWFGLKLWDAMRVTSPTTCRPFSKDRDGMSLGEGAGTVLLEPLEAALARGAQPLAEIVGVGMSADADHVTRPAPRGAELAIRRCLKDAGLNPEDVGYINAHGTATRANDVSESTAIRTVFGDYTDSLPVSSTKSMHGHALAAAGSLEITAATYALRTGVLPATINYNEPDPECPLNVIANEPREEQVDVALSNSFGFGGLNAVLALRKWEA